MADSIKLFLWKGGVLYIGPLADNSEHRHHAAQVCLGLEGSFQLFRKGVWQTSRFATIPANEAHSLDSKGKDLIVILLDGEASQACLINEHIAVPETQSLQLPQTCDEAREFVNNLISPLKPHQHEKDPRLAKVLTYIDTLETKQITASTLADIACLSESRFLHLWKEQIGLPVRRYLLWKRIIDTVEAVLAGNDLTAAAHLGGFSDSAHFSRTFRKAYGLSPSKLFKNSRNVQVITD